MGSSRAALGRSADQAGQVRQDQDDRRSDQDHGGLPELLVFEHGSGLFIDLARGLRLSGSPVARRAEKLRADELRRAVIGLW